MGHPTTPYLSLGSRLSRPIDSGDQLLLLDGDSIGGPLQTLPGKAEGCLRVVAPRFLRPSCGSGGPYPGHVLF